MDQKVLVIECYTNAIGLFILPAAQADRKGRFAHSTYPPAAFDYSVFGNLAKSYSGSFGIIQGGGIWGIVLPPWPAPALGAALAAAWIFRALRRRARQSKGRCLVCAYNLTGNISGVCPECGTAFQNAPAQSAAGTLTGGVGAP